MTRPLRLSPEGAGTCGFDPFKGPTRHRTSTSKQSSSTPDSPPSTPTSATRRITSRARGLVSVSRDIQRYPRRLPPASPVSSLSDSDEDTQGYQAQYLPRLFPQGNMAATSNSSSPDDDDSWYTPGIKYGGKGSAYTRLCSQPSPRTTIPAALLGGESNRLQQSLMASWQRAEPSDEQKKNIRDLLDRLTRLINAQAHLGENPSGTRYVLDVLGSVAWGGATGPSSDLDIIIIVSIELKDLC